MKKFFSIMLVAAMLATAASIGTVFAKSDEVTADTANTIIFSDVNDNTPGADAIKKLVNAGVVDGYDDGTFGPYNFLTRAELVKMVNLVFGYTEQAEENFWDVTNDKWYYDQVLVAKKMGYIVGFEDDSFGGERSLTREQVCVIINRCTDLTSLDTTVTVTDTVSDWALEDVKKVISNSLMPLEENNTFRATENITRTELAQVIASFVKDAEVELTPTATPTPEATATPKPTTKPSLGGGGGSSSSTKPSATPTPTPSFDNTEVVAHLNNVVADIDELFSGSSVRLTASERAVLTPIQRGIKGALSDADEHEITMAFIKSKYAADIDEAMDAYDALGDNQAEFRTKVLNAVDQETQDFLIDYFLAGVNLG